MAFDLTLDRLYVVTLEGGNTFTITARVPSVEEADAYDQLRHDVVDALAAMSENSPGVDDDGNPTITKSVAASLRHIEDVQRRMEQAACGLVSAIGDVTSGGEPLTWPEDDNARWRLFQVLIPKARRQSFAQTLFHGDTEEGVEGKSASFKMRRG